MAYGYRRNFEEELMEVGDVEELYDHLRRNPLSYAYKVRRHYIDLPEGGFVGKDAYEKFETAKVAAQMLSQRTRKKIAALDILHTEALETYRPLMLKELRAKERLYPDLPEEFQNDMEFIVAALETDGRNLQYLIPRLRDNKELVLIAVRKNGIALQFASRRMRRDAEVAKAAREQDHRANSFRLSGRYIED